MSTTDDVRVEAIPPEDVITPMKSRLRAAINDYRLAFPENYPTGANLAAYLRPGLAAKARRVNQLAAELRALDPAFPSSWVDLPEGT